MKQKAWTYIKKSFHAGASIGYLAPFIFSLLIFAAGSILTLTGTLPAWEGRLEILREVFPHSESSNFLTLQEVLLD